MKFTATVGELLRALNLVGTVVSTKTTIPILTHVLIKAMPDNRVTVVGTDLERECSADAPAEVEEIGAVALPGDILKGVVSRLPKAGNMTISLDQAKGRVSIISGRGKFALHYLEPEDFPEAKTAEGAPFEIEAKKLLAILEATVGTVATESNRYYLCGVYLHVKDGALVAASNDSYRMCRRTTDLPVGAESLPGIIIPTAAVTTMMTLLEDCEHSVSMWVTRSRIWLKTKHAEFSTALINGQYPDYERAIPPFNGAAATVSGADLAAAVERAAATLPEAKAVGAGLTVTPDGLEIKVGPRNAETAVEHIDAEIHKPHDEAVANAKFIAAMTKVWGTAPIDIHLGAGRAALVFTSKAIPEQTYIIMPMKR